MAKTSLDDHKEFDNFRFKIIFSVIGAALLMLMSGFGWLFAQDRTATAQQLRDTNAQLKGIYLLQSQVHELQANGKE